MLLLYVCLTFQNANFQEIGHSNDSESKLTIEVYFEEGIPDQNLTALYEFLLSKGELPKRNYIVGENYLATTLPKDSVLLKHYVKSFNQLLCKLNPGICKKDSVGETIPVYKKGQKILVPDLDIKSYLTYQEYIPSEKEELEESIQNIIAAARRKKTSEESINLYLENLHKKIYVPGNDDFEVYKNEQLSLHIPYEGYRVRFKIKEEMFEKLQNFILETPNCYLNKIDNSNSVINQSLINLEPTGTISEIEWPKNLEYYYPSEVQKELSQPTVAVVDSGFDLNHGVFFNSKKVNAFNKVDAQYLKPTFRGPFRKRLNEPKEHGTHIAGIIGGRNFSGFHGIHPQVNLQAYDHGNSGECFSIANLINSAVGNNSKIINLSFSFIHNGHDMRRCLLKRRIEQYKNVLFVAAAGNHMGEGSNTPFTPEDVGGQIFLHFFRRPNLILVGAMNRGYKNLLDFSYHGNLVIHLAAPGEEILSAVSGNQFAFSSGTSQAAAFVSGTSALIKSLFPHASPLSIKERMIYSSNLSSGLENKVFSGSLNIRRAVENIDKDVVFLKSGGPPLVGQIIYHSKNSYIYNELGETELIKLNEIRRIVWKNNTYSLILSEKNDDLSRNLKRLDNIHFKHRGMIVDANTDDKISIKKMNNEIEKIDFTNIKDLLIKLPEY